MGALGSAVLASLLACQSSAESIAAPEGSASAAPLATPRELDETVVPPPRRTNPNPLELPLSGGPFAEGAFVYAVPERMLASAKLGASLELRAARVEAMDGRDVIVRIGTGPAYSIHPAYVVAPRPGRVQRGTRVIAPHRERLRHGIVQRETRNHVFVRHTDVGVPLGDQAILPAELGVLGTGLEPGAHALATTEPGKRLVVLVSSGAHPDGVVRWLALGAEGEAMLLAATDLTPAANAHNLKPGASVVVAWRGEMVPATVRTVEPSGLVSVKRPRMGPALFVGPDMLLPAPEPSAE
ncbi:MAG: hypothetical protein FJ096_04675 [Deltaproteobacteria bacterium]|nr:hypothetical protein [Deltaproteobacteria bacterium]